MKILFACVLLMLLSATVLSGSNIQPRDTSSATVFPTNESDESRKLTPKQRYEKFILQHIKINMTAENCESEMKNNINKNNKNHTYCKEKNTFILANEQVVKNICNGEGQLKNNNMTYSKRKFDIVVCNQIKLGANELNCQYQGTYRTKRVVIVVCEGGFPVHYHGDKPNFAE